MACLFLSAELNERVRVLQRHDATSAPPSTAAVASGPSSIGPARTWCIAQREDGELGLIPSVLLQKTPGPPFSLFQVATAQQQKRTATTRHFDPLLDTSMTPVLTEKDINETAAGRPKQWYRVTGPVSSVSPGELGEQHCFLSLDTPQPLDEPSTGGDGEETCLQLGQEAAEMEADIGWLSQCVLPQVREAIEMKKHPAAPPITHQQVTTTAAAASISTLEERSRQLKSLATIAEQLLQWLHGDSGIAASCGSDAEGDLLQDLAAAIDGMELKSGTSPSSMASNTRDAPRGGEVAAHYLSTSVGVSPPLSMTTKRLYALIAEERETHQWYILQEKELQKRRRSMQLLRRQLSDESATLSVSEVAIAPYREQIKRWLNQKNVAEATDAVERWPCHVDGLTEEEDATLRAHLHTVEKYRRKLLKQRRGSSRASSQTRAETHPSTDGQKTAASVSTSGQQRIEYLRGILKEGCAEESALQRRIDTARLFVAANTPVALEIDEQIARGRRILQEKESYLQSLTASLPLTTSPRDASS